jgi:hypothetical protein
MNRQEFGSIHSLLKDEVLASVNVRSFVAPDKDKPSTASKYEYGPRPISAANYTSLLKQFSH